MARKHKPEEIIGKLREAETVPAQGGVVADARRLIGITGVPTAMVASWRTLRDMLDPTSIRHVAALQRNLKANASGLLPRGHGTSIEGLSEVLTFSILAWRSIFQAAGLR